MKFEDYHFSDSNLTRWTQYICVILLGDDDDDDDDDDDNETLTYLHLPSCISHHLLLESVHVLWADLCCALLTGEDERALYIYIHP